MNATLPMNRVGHYFDAAATEEPELPKSARERGRLWSDTVFQAVLALRKQLASRDDATAAAAANSILELERTRMRHGQRVAGSEEVSEAQEEYEAEQDRAAERFRVRRAEAAQPVSMPAETAPPPEPKRPDRPALAGHVREAGAMFEQAGHPMTAVEGMKFVEGILERLGLEARDVPQGGFVALLRSLDEPTEPTRSAA